MTNTTTYENLQFNRHVNIINKDYFPKTFPLHWHKYVEVIIFPSEAKNNQSSLIQVNQAFYHMNPGDILFVWPGELHQIIDNKKKSLIGVQFPATFFHELPDFSPYTNLFRTFHHLCEEKNPDLVQNLFSHIKQMLSLYEQNRPFGDVELLICLYEMFMDFGTYINHAVLDENGFSMTNEKKSLQKLNQVCNYIIENCDQALTLNMAADYAGFSSCYFSKLFKFATGYNFIEYLTLQRIKRAQMLLSDSALNITDICYQSGFKSLSTFNRVFRQYRSCTPTEYRHYYLT